MIYRQKIGIGLPCRSSSLLLSTCWPGQDGAVRFVFSSDQYRYESPHLIPLNVPEVIVF